MNKVIKIKQSDIKNIVNNVIREQSDLDEVRGKWKPEWDKEDHILAMFNSRYGVQELGVTPSYVANKVIGTTEGSFIKSSLNFDALDGKKGLSNYNKTDRKPEDVLPVQLKVHEEFKDVPKEEFKSICLNIIQEKENNPNNFTLGNEIGNKRDDINKTREKLLRDKGYDPKKLKMISQRPTYKPSPDEDEPTDIQPQTPKRKTPKDEIKDFMQKIYQKAMESNPELGEDIQFISDYIDSELVDKDIMSEIRKIFKPILTESKKKISIKQTDIKRIVESIDKIKNMKKVIKIKQSDIRNIVNNVLNEQGYAFEQSDNPDYAAEENDQQFNGESEVSYWDELEDVIRKIKDGGDSLDDVIGMAQDIFDENDNQPENAGWDNSGASDMGEQGFMYENKNGKKVIHIKESEMRKLIRKSLNEGFDDNEYGEISNKEYARQQEKRFYDTKSEGLPEKVKDIIKKCEHFFNCQISEDEILLRDRGGNVYAKGPGISVTHATSSIENGPGHDYSDEIMSLLKHSGFESANSYGDNGMDGNDGQDTYWTYEYIYKPLVKYME